MISEHFKETLFEFLEKLAPKNLDAYADVVLRWGSKPDGVRIPLVCLTDSAAYVFVEANLGDPITPEGQKRLLDKFNVAEAALLSYLEVSASKILLFAVRESDSQGPTVFHRRAYQDHLKTLRCNSFNEPEELFDLITANEDYFRRRNESGTDRQSKFNREDRNFYSSAALKLDFASDDGERVKRDAEGNAYIRKRNQTWAAADPNTDGKKLFLLSTIGGAIGAHQFFQKKTVKGLLYALTCGAFGAGWILNSAEILLGIYKSKSGLYVIPPKIKPIQMIMCYLAGIALTVALAFLYRTVLIHFGLAMADVTEKLASELSTLPSDLSVAP